MRYKPTPAYALLRCCTLTNAYLPYTYTTPALNAPQGRSYALLGFFYTYHSLPILHPLRELDFSRSNSAGTGNPCKPNAYNRTVMVVGEVLVGDPRFGTVPGV